MDVLVEVRESSLKRIDVERLYLVVRLEIPELIFVEDDVGQLLIALMCWAASNESCNDLLDVETRAQNRCEELV